jgi:hypothetical protein
MEVYQNLLEGIQGQWNCTKAINQSADQILEGEFSLLISENLISRSGESDQFWPKICSFELVGSIKDGYFYREDGCFIQVRSLTDQKMVIEVSKRDVEGQLDISIFNFIKEED